MAPSGLKAKTGIMHAALKRHLAECKVKMK